MNTYRLYAASLAVLVLLTLMSALPTWAQGSATPAAQPTVPPAQPPAEPTPPPLPPGGFIVAEGSQLTRLGQPVTIKGVNYYPQGRPWAEMWSTWDALQTQREWALAREHLGINTVRVLIPYHIKPATAIVRLKELAQIAGNLDMRLIVTLFDFEDSFPPPGSAEEQRHFDYVQTIIGNFVGDDRILAWDVHNEPDHYPTWLQGNAPAVLLWLGRMADEVRRIAPNHLVTVGMGQYDNLWQPGPDGRRVIDYSDVISMHNYNAPDTARQLYELRTHTDKPILLGEFGWPSGPTCAVNAYNEATQEWVFRTTLQAARAADVAGVVAWTLRDYHAGPTIRWDTREEHYGLYRPDHSLKPAALVLAAYDAPALPSVVSTDLPLTSETIHPPGGPFAPKFIPESGYHVKGWFRIAWELFGGRGSLGLPLGEAFVRPEDGTVVQYFEAAVLEFHDERGTDTSYSDLHKFERALKLIKPVSIGSAYTQGRAFPKPERKPEGGRMFETGYSIQGDFRRFYEGSHGEWRLGKPISQEVEEELHGRPTRVQYFQKGRLEVNPLNGVIQFGQLGSWAFAQRCTP
jgi:hypothetical protein